MVALNASVILNYKSPFASKGAQFLQHFNSRTSTIKARPLLSSITLSLTNAPPHSPLNRRPQNVDGEFYVNHECIDCDVCRWMAPEIFQRSDGQSVVYKQPTSAKERTAALQALLSCPVASIRTEKPPSDILDVHLTLPLPIDEKSLPGVYHCGYHSRKSFGATSYLIKHPEGNILVDSPSYKGKLVHQIEALGGARYIFLTHRDDVADHDKWARRLSCERILHAYEVESHTADVERKIEGQGPWSLGPDIDLIFTPGHTEGCVSLFYKPLKALFTGDHLAASANGELVFSEIYNFYSVEKQLENIQSLLRLDFLWILPGHGRRIEFKSINEKNAAIEKLLMKYSLQLA